MLQKLLYIIHNRLLNKLPCARDQKCYATFRNIKQILSCRFRIREIYATFVEDMHLRSFLTKRHIFHDSFSAIILKNYASILKTYYSYTKYTFFGAYIYENIPNMKFVILF